MSERFKKDSPQGEGNTATQEKIEAKRPPLYKVLLLNDDYTTMEFVIQVLQKFFNKAYDEATQIMLHVHHKGKGVCGFYPLEIAETKILQVTHYAKQNEYPLQCTLEQA